jgi:protocadherin-15
MFHNLVLPVFTLKVLQMSVPLDDSDSYNDLQLDFSGKNHAFSLDNVSYITKENGDSIGKGRIIYIIYTYTRN